MLQPSHRFSLSVASFLAILIASGCSSSSSDGGADGAVGGGGLAAAGVAGFIDPASVGGGANGGSAGGGGVANSVGGVPGVGGRIDDTGPVSVGGAPSTTLPPLSVVGNTVKDPSGKTIILRGSSLLDIGTLYIRGNSKLDWITSRIDRIIEVGLQGHFLRIPVYPRIVYNGGWPHCSNLPYPVGSGPGTTCTEGKSISPSDYINTILKPAVDYATAKNLYVVIDYHQIDKVTTGTSSADANIFWAQMAPVFANYPNVLYEAFNEPMDTGAWAAMKPMAQSWIDTIRAGAPNNIIIVSNPSWAQYPGDAAADPPIGTNLVYTAHIYPGNWKAGFQAQVTKAAALAPVFFTEWGYDLNSSDAVTGTMDATWGENLRTVIDQSGGSWTAWVLDYSWTPKLFADGKYETLTEFGTFTKTWLADKATSDWVE